MSPRGFVAPSAVVTHPNLVRGIHVYIGDKTMIQDAGAGGEIKLMEISKITTFRVKESTLGKMGEDTRVNGRVTRCMGVGFSLGVTERTTMANM